MAIQIQLRRGTAAEWTSGDPTLAVGEMGVETDTGKIKVGDGSTAWTSLGYTTPNLNVSDIADVTISSLSSGETLTWNGSAWVNTDLTSTITANIVDSAPATLDTLNEIAAALNDDADFSNTIANSIATKADVSHTHSLADVTDVTATAAELNVLDGITATVTELNYTDGVTSGIQAQLDSKVSKTNGTVTTADTSSTVVRNITLSTSDPTGGIDGDVWLKYTA
jgi:hypothetical protein